MGSVRSRIWKGEKVYWVDYRDATGARVRQTVGAGEENRRLAKRVLAQREAEAKLGIHNIQANQSPRFREVALDWLELKRPPRTRPKTYESYEDAIEHLLPAFGEKRLSSITRADIESWHQAPQAARRRKGQKKAPGILSITSVNYNLNVLKFILKDAIERNLLSVNPATQVKRLPAPDKGDAESVQHLTPAEIDRLLNEAEEPYRTLYLIAVSSGLRRGELLALRWRNVTAGVLDVRRSLGRFRDGTQYVVQEKEVKTKHSRRKVELSPTTAAFAALLALPAGDDPKKDYVFRSRAGGFIDPDNLDRAWKRHLTLAKIADLPFHSTRHTHASLLIAAGVHPKAIQARLGHASITTTLNTYGHLMPSAYEGVGDKVDALIWANSGQTTSAESKNGIQAKA